MNCFVSLVLCGVLGGIPAGLGGRVLNFGWWLFFVSTFFPFS